MSAEPDGGEWTFESHDSGYAGGVAYGNGVWLLVQTIESAPFTYDTKLFTAESPDEGWTERMTVSGYKTADPNYGRRILFADGKWVICSDFESDFLVVESDFSSYSLEPVPSTLGAYDVAYGDGYWICVSPTLFGQQPRMYRATSIAGGWTWVDPANIAGIGPTTVAFNGERWVAGGFIQGTPSSAKIVTTTDPTGSWTTATVDDSSAFGFSFDLIWVEQNSEWLMGWSTGATSLVYRWASADASSWSALGYNPNCSPSLRQTVAAGDGYIVSNGRYQIGSATRTTYLQATSFGASGTATILDSSTNTASGGSGLEFASLTYGDGRFVMAGKPSTQSTSGVVTSPSEDGGAGWGVLL